MVWRLKRSKHDEKRMHTQILKITREINKKHNEIEKLRTELKAKGLTDDDLKIAPLLESSTPLPQSQKAIRRIRNYSGQEMKGPELMQQLGLDHLG